MLGLHVAWLMAATHCCNVPFLQMVNRGSIAQAEQLEALSKAELLSILSYGADRIFASSAGHGPTDEDLDQIIDRSNTPHAKNKKSESCKKSGCRGRNSHTSDVGQMEKCDDSMKCDGDMGGVGTSDEVADDHKAAAKVAADDNGNAGLK